MTALQVADTRGPAAARTPASLRRLIWLLALAPVGLIPDSRANPLDVATVVGINVSVDKISVAGAFAATFLLRPTAGAPARTGMFSPSAQALGAFILVTSLWGLLDATSGSVGAVAFVGALAMLEYVTFVRLFRAGESMATAARWLAFVGAVNGALATYQWRSGSTWPVRTGSHTVRGFYDDAGDRLFRSTGLVSEPQVLATIAVVSLIATFALLGRSRTGVRSRVLLLVGAVLTTSGLICSFSRGGIFVGFGVLAVWIVLGSRARGSHRLVVGATAAATGWYVARASFAAVLIGRLQNTTDGSYATRLETWAAVRHYLAGQDLFHVLFGNGLGAYLSVRPLFGPIDNAYLTLVLELGLVGLVLLCLSALPVARLSGDATWVKYAVLAVALNGMSYEVQYYSTLLPVIALALSAVAAQRSQGHEERAVARGALG